MDVVELSKLYQQAQKSRDETVRNLMAQSVAQAAAAQEALAKTREDAKAEGIDDDPVGAHLAKAAQSHLDDFAKLSASAIREGSLDAAEALTAESIAAETLAAEAIASETLAAEAAEGRFSAEPFAAEAAIAEATVAEGIAATTAALQTFVAESTRPGR